MISKICFKCHIEKPLADFYRHPRMSDGHLNKCKACTKKDVSQNYRGNIDHYIVYEKKRSATLARKKLAGEYLRRRDPLKRRANYAVGNAIRDKRLIPKPCEVCGVEKSEAHHEDYSRPLDVKWLCRKHHLQAHGKQVRVI